MCDEQGVVSWGMRGTVLTQSWLIFYDEDEPTYTTEIERIPLIEIFRLSSKYAEENTRDSCVEAPSRDKVFLVLFTPRLWDRTQSVIVVMID